MIQQKTVQQGISLNKQQQEAVRHHYGPAIVLAVAGAGKTTMMCARIAALMMNQGVAAKKIKNLTFSRASARDMQHRFTTLFKGLKDSEQVDFSTIHSMAYQLVSAHYRQQKTAFQLIEDRSQRIHKPRVLRAIYQQINGAYPMEDEMDELLQKISLMKNRMISMEDIGAQAVSVKGFDIIYKRYESYKKANGWLDYDDLLTTAHDLLSKNKDFRTLYQQKYQYWQVDEFQDTSLLQWHIIKTLAAPHNNLFCVGDDDQMVYSFRGSSPQLMLQFSQQMPGATVYFMEENYRCSREVVSLSNHIIQHNEQRHPKTARANSEHSAMIQINQVADGLEQVKAVLQEIAFIQSSMVQSVGILYRNNLSAVTLADALRQQEIPFTVRDLKMHFSSHWLTQDLLNIIDFAYHPEDFAIFEQIYYKMNGYISKSMIQWIKRNPPKSGQSVLTHLEVSGLLKEMYQKKSVRELASQLSALTTKKQQSIIYHLVDQLGYGQYLERKNKLSQETGHQLLEVLACLCNDLGKAEDLRAKLESLRFISKKTESMGRGVQAEGNVITLTTIHSAKGLEFDHVILLDVAENLFPSPGSIKDTSTQAEGSLLEEERRLLYVAITRTRRDLTIYAPESCFRKRRDKSLFLHELQQAIDDSIRKPSENNQISEHCPLEPGDQVTHHTFGNGYVTDVSDKTIGIRFGSEVKNIAMDFVKKVLTMNKG